MPVAPPPVIADLTFGGVVDRVFRDWLHGPDEQPVVTTLTAAMSDAGTTLALDLSPLTPDELSMVSMGTLIEVEYEQCFITAVSGSTLTVARGRNATEAVEHSEGSLVTLMPMWGRQTVLDAVLDEVPRLFPDLHAIYTTTVTSSSVGYAELPAAAQTITRAYRALPSGTYVGVGGLELLSNFPPSSTGKAVQFHGTPSGQTIHLAYKGAFTRPVSPTSLLDDYGVAESWVPILCVGAAASIIASEDIDKATVEFVTRQLEAQQFSTGSGSRLRDGLLRYRQYLIEQARRTVRAEDPHTSIVYNQAVYG